MMQNEEQAMEEGLLEPMKRLLVLGVVSYFAAVAASRNFWCFPLFDSFFLPWAVLHVPVMGFCIVVSVMNRSTSFRTSVLCGGATFAYYALDEIDDIADGTGIVMYGIVVSGIVHFICFRRWS